MQLLKHTFNLLTLLIRDNATFKGLPLTRSSRLLFTPRQVLVV